MMQRIPIGIWAISLVALLVGVACTSTLPEHSTDTGPVVRVCLGDQGREIRIGLHAPVDVIGSGFRAPIDGAGTLICRLDSSNSLVVEAGGRTLHIPGGMLRCRHRGPGHVFDWEGRQYADTLIIATDGRVLYLINTLPVESYLASVVTNEMGRNRKPEECAALQAQAVLARTMVLRKIESPLARLFDVHADTRDQVFTGPSGVDALTREAVQSTRGLVLTCDGSMGECYFHSCCGGHTDDPSAIWNHASTSTCLTGVRDHDSHGDPCRIAPSWRWSEQYTRQELEPLLRTYLPSANEGLSARDFPAQDWHLLDLRILKRSAGGRVQVLEVVMGNRMQQRSYYVRGDRVRQALRRPAGHKPLRSARFDLSITRDRNNWILGIRIDGAGSGHGIGMCQWGAIARARDGMDMHEILAAYFPGSATTAHY
jgi:stage II sporulation protein D